MPRRRTRPKTTARRRSSLAWLTEGRPRSRAPVAANRLELLGRRLPAARRALLRPEPPDHEAHVRVAGVGGGLEDALYDERLHLAIDLKNDDARKLLSRVQLLPELALVLQNVEELLHALK